MPATEVRCKITEKLWITPTVMRIRFEPSKKFRFEAGQFLSVVIPSLSSKVKPLRRAYSFAAPDREEGYELCIKHIEDGPGSSYMAGLDVGDSFQAFAPYGDFVYEQREARRVCFVSTGTGVAPFKAMAMSRKFQENPPLSALSVFGARDQEELLYTGFFEKLGVQEAAALSQPKAGWNGYRGRVTDYLKSLGAEWAWRETDFYLCGNGAMVTDVRKILLSFGV
ncbi:MAG: ferredoxin--NADP reductase, partial [Bdellovibrionota bacterium]